VIIGLFLAVMVLGFIVVWLMISRRRLAPAGRPAMGAGVPAIGVGAPAMGAGGPTMGVAGPAMAGGQLVVTRGQASRGSLDLAKPLITLGRDPASDLALIDGQVSRHHAQIRLQDGGVVIHDLGTLNGTFVNGERVSGSRSLYPGDRIALGSTEVVFQSSGGYQAPRGGAQLAVVQGSSQPPALSLQQKPVVIVGRDATCDIVIVGDLQVSRRHAQIQWTAQGYEVVDLGSANGLLVNGQRVPRATLRSGDRIRLGNTEFVYQG